MEKTKKALGEKQYKQLLGACKSLLQYRESMGKQNDKMADGLAGHAKRIMQQAIKETQTK